VEVFVKKKTPLVSVIVPSFKEGISVEKNLTPLQRDPRIEVIVVDAQKVGRANRAYQMNHGARQARAELLVFLHADTKISRNDLYELFKTLEKGPEIVGGAFRFALDAGSWKARLIEIGVLLREWAFDLPYGDQAIFVRRSVFRKIGGYPEAPLLEDVLLIQKMKEKGKLLFFPKKAVTSARRWERHGYLKTTLVNWATMAFWKAGVSTRHLQLLREKAFA
jgi:cellulose synthase/poly-beta-1,6-N-acetylglucosamine synthase-like glycosyltransferase